MFTDDSRYEFFSRDQFLYGVMVNLTKELTMTIADL